MLVVRQTPPAPYPTPLPCFHRPTDSVPVPASSLLCSACNGLCDKICSSPVIDSVDAAQSLKDCTVIAGNLDINIRQGSECRYTPAGTCHTAASHNVDKTHLRCIIANRTSCNHTHTHSMHVTGASQPIRTPWKQ